MHVSGPRDQKVRALEPCEIRAAGIEDPEQRGDQMVPALHLDGDDVLKTNPVGVQPGGDATRTFVQLRVRDVPPHRGDSDRVRSLARLHGEQVCNRSIPSGRQSVTVRHLFPIFGLLPWSYSPLRATRVPSRVPLDAMKTCSTSLDDGALAP